ncbi:prolyl oligopeptidase family-domain-containing protein [Baffinella frigidus]|nr:prolyl oligopeptidase family-domain-containing protein [Cryptophyta sp. CCMP2293]
MAVHGASAGGLLVAALSNEYPDAVAACIALWLSLSVAALANEYPDAVAACIAKTCALEQVPFVDIANTMQDDTLALTVHEYDEWGNVTEASALDYVKSYSPYGNVRAQRYPHMMLTASFNDTRVGFWEPAKLAAKLRAVASDTSGTLLLITSFENGHFGTGGRVGHLADLAREAAFLQRAFKMTSLGVSEDKCDFECKKGGWLGA